MWVQIQGLGLSTGSLKRSAYSHERGAAKSTIHLVGIDAETMEAFKSVIPQKMLR